jgi:hypothetical protein
MSVALLQAKEKFFIHQLWISKPKETQHFQIRVPLACEQIVQVMATTNAYQADPVVYQVGELTLKTEEIFFQGEVGQHNRRMNEYCLHPVFVNLHTAHLFGFYKDTFLRPASQEERVAGRHPYRVRIYFRYREKLLTDC